MAEEPYDLDAAIEDFRTGSIRYHAAAFFDNEPVMDQALDLAIKATNWMWAHREQGRETLVRLMREDPDSGVRVMAANELLSYDHELALPTLIHIRDNAGDESADTAFRAVLLHNLLQEFPHAAPPRRP